jgi:hypothetical protein
VDSKAAQMDAAFDPGSSKLFVVNRHKTVIDVLDLSNPSQPKQLGTFGMMNLGNPEAVAVHGNVLAVAIASTRITPAGTVVFFDFQGNALSQLTVGSNPKMIVFTPDGKKLLVANEGAPDSKYRSDPDGTVSIIDMSAGAAALTASDVTTVTLSTAPIQGTLHRAAPAGTTLAQDLEPEYIAVASDSQTAWITLQENNAIATLDITRGKITQIIGLGVKDHSKAGNGLDASDLDGGTLITSHPVFGMYQPDSIGIRTKNGSTYLLTANGGAARDRKSYSEEERISKLKLDPNDFVAGTQSDKNLGRLQVSTARGDTDGDGLYDELYSFGARSWSVWTEQGKLVWDSGDAIEQKMAQLFPQYFNVERDRGNTADTRSDNKGPEPECLSVGEVDGKHYVFVGLERQGGVLIYDVSDPTKPSYVDYIHSRIYSGDPTSDRAGDLAPEDIVFVKASDSPTGKALMIVTYEVSGSTTTYELERK